MKNLQRNKFPNTSLSLLLLLLILSQLSGCVSTSAYDELYQQYVAVSQERDELVKKRNALEGNTVMLRNQVEVREEQKKRLAIDLEQTNEQLSESNRKLEDTNRRLAMTNEELSQAEDNLKSVSQNLEARNQELNLKNAELDSTNNELSTRQQELMETTRKLEEADKKIKATAEYMARTNKLYDELVEELSSELKANEIKIKEIKDGVTVNLSQNILFPSGSASLNENGIQVIKRVSGKLMDIPHQIIVAGFTDNVPIKGQLAKQYPTNWELAGARAASVVRLLENEGVDSDKLTAVSFGENKPVASNDHWETRKQNRRIEIRLRPVE